MRCPITQTSNGSTLVLRLLWRARWSRRRAKDKNGNSLREISKLSVAPTKVIRSRKRGTRRNFCARSRTCVHDRIFSVACSVCVAGSRLPFTSFFRIAVSFTFTHPIITGSDCEGAGELFRVSTIDIKNPPQKNGEIDYAQDFFARQTYLTVSGQLEAEAFACALTKVYTFGPTFRAENSNTSRHASEFWMIEPEMAFCDLTGNMDLAEELVKYLIADARKQCAEELELFAKFVDKELLARLDFVIERPFQRITYTEAVELLKKSGEKFEFPIDYGSNLQSEHERWLTEKHFKCPVTVFNFPKEIKPFYMRSNDDGRTVAAIDLLVPGIGEIVGGSQREERLEMLEDNMRRHNMDPADYKWYLDLRRYGTVPHSGFGLGFERMLMFITGISNIRDVIPFARTPGSAEF